MLEVNHHFKEFLAKHFSFVESKFENRVDIYSSQNLKLRIVRDHNSKLYMDITILENPQNPNDWIILSDLKSYMLNNDDYLKVNDFDETANFLISNHNKITELLNTDYENVKRALTERGKIRAEKMFGTIKSTDSYSTTITSRKTSQTKNPANWWRFWEKR
jgi:hypothetical protein